MAPTWCSGSMATAPVTVEPPPHVHLSNCGRPGGRRDWRVSVVEVEDTIRAACRRRRVLEAVADHYRWARSLEVLDAEGIPVGEFPQSPVRMGPGQHPVLCRRRRPAADHDGSAGLVRHVANAVVKEDSCGARLAKEHKDSKRRIDAP
jgi:phage terminase large subunit-like protein